MAKTNNNNKGADATFPSQKFPPHAVRIPTQLKKKYQKLASAAHRSLAGQIVWALEDWMDRHEAELKQGS